MRTEFIKQYLAKGMFATCPSYLEGIVSTVNSGEVAYTDNEIAESHSYETKGSVAIITVDGATTKKNTWMNAMCGGFVPYDAISNYIDKAEADSNIEKIVFNVDSPGGEVAGVDNLGEKIHSCSKETITYYNNLGASAAIWAFSSSKKIYANETAMIGSIGVMSGYYKEDENDNKVVLVSKNAKNKNCSLSGNCADKIQSRIDQVEDIFYSRVSRNTGLSSKDIAEKFGYGDVVSAQEAKKAGVVAEVLPFDTLLKSLVVGAVPSQEKPAAKITKKETAMAENTELEQAVAQAQAEATQRAADIAAIGSKYGISQDAIHTAISGNSTVAEFQTVALDSLQEQLVSAQATNADTSARLEEAIKTGASEDDGATQEPQATSEETQEEKDAKLALEVAKKIEV